MNASDRLLLNVISHIIIIFYMSASLTCGNEPEFFSMACIMEDKLINILYLMMRRIKGCA